MTSRKAVLNERRNIERARTLGPQLAAEMGFADQVLVEVREPPADSEDPWIAVLSSDGRYPIEVPLTQTLMRTDPDLGSSKSIEVFFWRALQRWVDG